MSRRLVAHFPRRARGWLRDRLPDALILARRFARIHGRPIDWNNPRTFGEKLFWLMRYQRDPLVTRLADKYEVRDYVAERVGPEILNDLYGVWDRVADIDFPALPEAFVLKVNWGWRAQVVCPRRSELDVPTTRSRLAEWMARSHYWIYREWPYKNIRPRVLCERLLVDPAGDGLVECNIWCFAGEPRFIRVYVNRATSDERHLLDVTWGRPSFTLNGPGPARLPARPSNLEEMLDCARRLSRGWPFVRVDLYAVAGRTVFSEMTWTPGAGMNRFEPAEYDRYWGDALPLPVRPGSRGRPGTIPGGVR